MRRKVLATGVAVLAVAGGGAAIAATGGLGAPEEQSKAVVDDAAAQLGVDPAELSDALKQAFENRVDAAVASGAITEEEGAALKARIEAQDYPMLAGPGFGRHGGGGPGFGHHGGPGGHLAAAATYLGLSDAELRTELEAGKTLADVATAQGKTVDGLVAALVADEKQELDEAVSAGRITQAQADELLAGAQERLTELANGAMPQRGHHGRGFGPGGFGGLPPVEPSDDGNAAA